MRSPDAEDAIFTADLGILRLLAEIERLTRMLPRTTAAKRAVRIATDERANLAARLRAEGMTVRDIAIRLDRTERQVYRLLNR